MLYRALDLSYSARRGRIDDEPLQRLLHGHEVVWARERLYFHEGLPHLLVTVVYRLAALPQTPPGGPDARRDPRAAPASSPASAPRPDPGSNEVSDTPDASPWRSVLRDESVKLLEELRAWRSARARAEAVPAYVILTNIQLAHVANERPRTLTALGSVPGIGGSRVERYGRDILEVVERGVVPVPEESRDAGLAARREGAPAEASR